MSLDNETLELAKTVAQEVSKDVYHDTLHPALETTGEIIDLIPRAIKVALNPLQKWILQGEYNIEETKKLLEKKLEKEEAENIVPPEPYVALPALQYISYCMDNEELRDMYANLLANSMNKIVKNGVHPGFLEIIKQLSPDEAKIIKYIFENNILPFISLRRQDEHANGIVVVPKFTNLGDICGCESPYSIDLYLTNLERLGLIELIQEGSSLQDKKLYEPLKKHPKMLQEKFLIENSKDGFNKAIFSEGYLRITSLGNSFGRICLETTK